MNDFASSSPAAWSLSWSPRRRHSLYTRAQIRCTWRFPLALLSPFAFFCSLLPPFVPLLLTWNPPCCDRIRPPRSQVARKLTSRFPPLAHIPHIPKSRPPGVSQPQIYIHKDDIANLAHKIEHNTYLHLTVKLTQIVLVSIATFMF
jgi:hypothetical protein